MVWPVPPHFGQGWAMEKKPRLTATWPCPRQVEQVTTLEPEAAPVPSQWEQGAGRRMVISFSHP
jgi:hypothetical protein